MSDFATTRITEDAFASMVDELAQTPNRSKELITLLREDHEIYDQRGAAATMRMRGWLLLALARHEISDDALIYILEELDTGNDPYLIAAASYALRSYPRPDSAFTPYLVRAITNIRYRNDPVSLEEYGAYAETTDATNPTRELLRTIAWLGKHAAASLPDLEKLRVSGTGLPERLHAEIDKTIRSIATEVSDETEACCRLPEALQSKFSWVQAFRRSSVAIESVQFEDHDGQRTTLGELFKGKPTIVSFFYTRCDNPLKCSLTITKVARLQKLLDERGFDDKIRIAAITYDSEFDTSERIRGFCQNRGMRLDANHRSLRVVEGFAALRKHFKLGVNFIESIVNRHRVEIYVLDRFGQIAAMFERIHWSEEEVADKAIEVLKEVDGQRAARGSVRYDKSRSEKVGPVLGSMASLALAFFPKCPICWAAYLSMFGIAGLERTPYSPWLQPILAAVMLINLASVWLRVRATGQFLGFYLTAIGSLLIIISRLTTGWEIVATFGIISTLAGSLLSVFNGRKRQATVNHETPK